MASSGENAADAGNGVNDDDDYDEIPLQYKRPFGTSAYQRPISFVPASADGGNLVSSSSQQQPEQKGEIVADWYLSIVSPNTTRDDSKATDGSLGEMCEICNLPLDSLDSDARRAHETTLAHQICIPHSHPPSALDRTRRGLAVLEQQGWDPDAREGLGASGQGIIFPVKVRPKNDHLGVGLAVPKNLPRSKRDGKPLLLNAGQVRKQVRDDVKKSRRIYQELFGSKNQDKLDKLLGRPGPAG
ncbi:hypothetical protein B0T24DRAFT_352948 [Lasiosphaeria ovina]|uniref:G-patch domain-containing protein n=1 Tax=Lasiosphaeria ovina TaxID=92902 RepID=A0AAE0K2V6_9PEZI|nr:hypothetical protein B0T24DRAFT_352948 [Lasiosphaeria ovina]